VYLYPCPIRQVQGMAVWLTNRSQTAAHRAPAQLTQFPPSRPAPATYVQCMVYKQTFTCCSHACVPSVHAASINKAVLALLLRQSVRHGLPVNVLVWLQSWRVLLLL
jgi:hypothetical protein